MGSQLLITLAIGYGSQYFVRYATDKMTSVVIGSATKAVKKKAMDVIYKDKPVDIDYEYINVDSSGEPILEPMCIVTSAKQQLIDQSWHDIKSQGGDSIMIARTPTPERIPGRTPTPESRHGPSRTPSPPLSVCSNVSIQSRHSRMSSSQCTLRSNRSLVNMYDLD
jgi:hypothetical protein